MRRIGSLAVCWLGDFLHLFQSFFVRLSFGTSRICVSPAIRWQTATHPNPFLARNSIISELQTFGLLSQIKRFRFSPLSSRIKKYIHRRKKKNLFVQRHDQFCVCCILTLRLRLRSDRIIFKTRFRNSECWGTNDLFSEYIRGKDGPVPREAFWGIGSSDEGPRQVAEHQEY